MNIRRIQVASPLTLVVLSACGGSSGGGALSTLLSGTAINGPLFGARVFLDIADANGDFDGVYTAGTDILASNGGLTDGLGDFTVDTATLNGQTYRLVVESLDTTRINYTDSATPELSDTQAAGSFTLTAPAPTSTAVAPVVTPITTLIEQGGLTASEVATALGLEGQDLLTLNPFEASDPSIGLKAEKVSMQIVTTLETLSSAAESAGAGGADAASAAVGALVNVITAKVNSSETLDLAPDSLADPNNDIAALQSSFKTELQTAGVNTASIDALEDEIARSIQVVNSGIDEIPEDTDLSKFGSDDSSVQEALQKVVNTFSSAKLLSDQVSDAVTSGNAGDITFTNEAAFEASVANTAPTGVTVNNNEVNEGELENSLVGVLTLVDGEDTNNNPSFSILDEADGSYFEILEGNKLSVKTALDFESADHTNGLYTVYVKGVDDGDKSTIQKLEIQSLNVAEPPTLDASATTATEDAAFTYTLKATDPEGDSFTINVTGLPSWLSFNSTTGILSGTPENDHVGDVSINVIMTDSTGKSATETFTISVQNVNDNPEVVSANLTKSVAQNASYSQVITATDVDNEASELTIALNTDASVDWVTFDSSTNTISGTPGSGDVGENTVTLTVTDNSGGSSSFSYVINVSNVNDAPAFATETLAVAIDEGADGAETTGTNLTGSLGASDPDSPFVVETLTFSLGSSQTTNSDGSVTLTDTIATLTVNQDGTYAVTHDAALLDALEEGDTTDEVFTVTVTDADGESDTLTLTVSMTGANNEPTITITNDDLPTLSNLGAGQFVADLTATDDVDTSVTFSLATTGTNDNASFVIDGSTLSMKGDVETDFDTKPSYTVDIIATDSAGATATATLTVNVSSTNSAPSVVSITTDTSSGLAGIGDNITFTARTSEAVNSGSSFELTLSNDATVTMTRSSNTDEANKFTGVYTVAEGDDTAASAVLSVASYNSGTVKEASYADGEQPLSLLAGSSTVDIGTLEVDATRPTATISNSGHDYVASSGVLTLVGTNLQTLGPIVSGEVDATASLDFTKLTWNVDGAGAETLTLAADDVSSAIATDASTLEITLTTAGRTKLHALEGFGGTTSTGGTADAINIALGFLKDVAGNSPASDTQVTNGSVTLESVRPTIDTISVSPTKSLYAIGDEIEITIVMSEDIRSDSTVSATLSNGGSVTFAAKANTTDSLVGTYTVASGEDVDSTDTGNELAIQALTGVEVLDLSGNKMSSTVSEIFSTSPTNGLTALDIDATAPTATVAATGHTYDASTGVITIIGTNLNTMGVVAEDTGNNISGDASAVVDVTKLTWDIDGAGTSLMVLSDADVDTVVLKDSTTLEITLLAGSASSNVGRTKLHALDGFGGTTATSGTADALDVAVGFLKDVAGNASSGLASPVANAAVALADSTAPEIATVTSSTSDGSVLGVGDTITFTAAMQTSGTTNAEAMKVGTSMTLTLSNGATVQLQTDPSTPTQMVGNYVIQDADEDTDTGSNALSISAYSVGTAVDVSGNALADDTTISGFDNVTAHVIDTTPPTATVAATGHTYDVSTGVITVKGTNFDTMGIVAADGGSNDGDASSVVDHTKLTWDIDGAGDSTMTLADADVASITLVDATTLTITLNAGDPTATPLVGRAKLHALNDFGGTSATGGTADAIDVAIGFLSDTAGNISTGLASPVSNAAMTLADTTAPAIGSITSNALAASFHKASDVIEFTATMASNENMKAGTTMSITLNNDAVVTLTRDTTNAYEMVGNYTIDAEDTDNDALAVVSYDIGTAVDLSGNALADDTAVSGIDNIANNVAVDTTAPRVTIETYVSPDLILVFNEAITNDSVTTLLSKLTPLTEVTGTDWTTNTDNTTFKIAATITGNSASTPVQLDPDDFNVLDAAGNILTIETLDIV